MTRARVFLAALLALSVVGALLRLQGIHAPILDHPGWRQGDTAAIARNFAQLQYNILYPQTDYDGPPPNYVELELQIVPFLAATLYKLFGVHEIFGRLISLSFGVATIALVGCFGRWLFRSVIAGIAAAALYAVLPGAWYYSRTFMPDTAMTFFATAALFASARWIVEERAQTWRGFVLPALLLAAAFLAKPVAVAVAIPIAAAAVAQFGLQRAVTNARLWALFAAGFVPLAVYGHIVSSHAEWHWASGITRLHIIPSLVAALTSPAAFAAKAVAFAHALRMLATTMLGPVGIVLAAAGLAVPLRARTNTLVWGWLAGGLLYAYVVVTVERVDYYLYLLLPLGALTAGRFCAWLWEQRRPGLRPVVQFATVGCAVWLIGWLVGRHEIGPYYAWSRVNYSRAKALDATLAPGALVVMGHLDPSILYTINRKGWEEDPHLWTPFDEQSAIRKGSRYFIAIEHARLKQTNLELYCWLSRFPLLDPAAAWPVYVTDPANVLAGAEERWHAFRRREMSGAYANWRKEWKTAANPC